MSEPTMAQQTVPTQKVPATQHPRKVPDWAKKFFAWLLRMAPRLIVIGVIVWGAYWLYADNPAQEQRMITMLQQDRQFDNVTVVENARNYGRLPFVNGEGTYSVAKGNCSFIVKFEEGVPVIMFADEVVKDADPTRLALNPVIGPQCLPVR